MTEYPFGLVVKPADYKGGNGLIFATADRGEVVDAKK